MTKNVNCYYYREGSCVHPNLLSAKGKPCYCEYARFVFGRELEKCRFRRKIKGVKEK